MIQQDNPPLQSSLISTMVANLNTLPENSNQHVVQLDHQKSLSAASRPSTMTSTRCRKKHQRSHSNNDGACSLLDLADAACQELDAIEAAFTVRSSVESEASHETQSSLPGRSRHLEHIRFSSGHAASYTQRTESCSPATGSAAPTKTASPICPASQSTKMSDLIFSAQKYSSEHKCKDISRKFTCRKCKAQFTSNSDIIQHINLEHWMCYPGKFLCKECLVTAKTPQQFMKHVANDHPGSGPHSFIPGKLLENLHRSLIISPPSGETSRLQCISLSDLRSVGKPNKNAADHEMPTNTFHYFPSSAGTLQQGVQREESSLQSQTGNLDKIKTPTVTAKPSVLKRRRGNNSIDGLPATECGNELPKRPRMTEHLPMPPRPSSMPDLVPPLVISPRPDIDSQMDATNVQKGYVPFPIKSQNSPVSEQKGTASNVAARTQNCSYPAIVNQLCFKTNAAVSKDSEPSTLMHPAPDPIVIEPKGHDIDSYNLLGTSPSEVRGISRLATVSSSSVKSPRKMHPRLYVIQPDSCSAGCPPKKSFTKEVDEKHHESAKEVSLTENVTGNSSLLQRNQTLDKSATNGLSLLHLSQSLVHDARSNRTLKQPRRGNRINNETAQKRFHSVTTSSTQMNYFPTSTQVSKTSNSSPNSSAESVPCSTQPQNGRIPKGVRYRRNRWNAALISESRLKRNAGNSEKKNQMGTSSTGSCNPQNIVQVLPSQYIPSTPETFTEPVSGKLTPGSVTYEPKTLITNSVSKGQSPDLSVVLHSNSQKDTKSPDMPSAESHRETSKVVSYPHDQSVLLDDTTRYENSSQKGASCVAEGKRKKRVSSGNIFGSVEILDPSNHKAFLPNCNLLLGNVEKVSRKTHSPAQKINDVSKYSACVAKHIDSITPLEACVVDKAPVQNSIDSSISVPHGQRIPLAIETLAKNASDLPLPFSEKCPTRLPSPPLMSGNPANKQEIIAPEKEQSVRQKIIDKIQAKVPKLTHDNQSQNLNVHPPESSLARFSLKYYAQKKSYEIPPVTVSIAENPHNELIPTNTSANSQDKTPDKIVCSEIRGLLTTPTRTSVDSSTNHQTLLGLPACPKSSVADQGDFDLSVPTVGQVEASEQPKSDLGASSAATKLGVMESHNNTDESGKLASAKVISGKDELTLVQTGNSVASADEVPETLLTASPEKQLSHPVPMPDSMNLKGDKTDTVFDELADDSFSTASLPDIESSDDEMPDANVDAEKDNPSDPHDKFRIIAKRALDACPENIVLNSRTSDMYKGLSSDDEEVQEVSNEAGMIGKLRKIKQKRQNKKSVCTSLVNSAVDDIDSLPDLPSATKSRENKDKKDTCESHHHMASKEVFEAVENVKQLTLNMTSTSDQLASVADQISLLLLERPKEEHTETTKKMEIKTKTNLPKAPEKCDSLFNVWGCQSDIVDNGLQCYLCGFQSKKEKAMIGHCSRHILVNPFWCSKCLMQRRSAVAIQRHIRTDHRFFDVSVRVEERALQLRDSLACSLFGRRSGNYKMQKDENIQLLLACGFVDIVPQLRYISSNDDQISNDIDVAINRLCPSLNEVEPGCTNSPPSRVSSWDVLSSLIAKKPKSEEKTHPFMTTATNSDRLGQKLFDGMRGILSSTNVVKYQNDNEFFVVGEDIHDCKVTPAHKSEKAVSQGPIKLTIKRINGDQSPTSRRCRSTKKRAMNVLKQNMAKTSIVCQTLSLSDDKLLMRPVVSLKKIKL